MTNETVLRVQIDRSRWLRGADHSTLRNADSGHECVVGCIARTAGIPADSMDNRIRVSAEPGQQLPEALAEFATRTPSTARDPRAPEREFSCRYLLYSINDDPWIGDTMRERMLTAVAGRIGIALRFTGTALPPHAIAPTSDGRAIQGLVSRGERSDSPARCVEMNRRTLAENGEWQPLDTTRLVLDADPESIWAYAYDLLRSEAHEHRAAVRLTVVDTATGRTIADTYHEPAR